MKQYSESLQETYDLFQSQNISILGRGFEEVMSSPQLFEGYVTSLTEGASPDSRAQMAQLMANTNAHLLTEGSVAGLAPISSLSGPVIRKLWPMFAMKNAVRTEVAKTPSFLISYTRPYYITADAQGKEVKHYVPRPGLIADQDANLYQAAGDLNGSYITKVVTVGAASGVGTADFTTECTVSGSASAIKVQPLDADFTLAAIALVPGEGDTEVWQPIGKKVGVENVIVYDYHYGTNGASVATVLVRLDAEACKATVSVVGGPATGLEFKLIAHRSVEYNEKSTSWAFDVAREDIRIGTGEHMNAPLAVEALTDMKALYQIDGTQEAVNLMTNAMALDVDARIFRFLKDSFINQPGVGEFAGYPTATKYLAVFDVKAEPGFAGGPKAWREELKPVIDHRAGRIKNQTFLGAGIFNIVANPLDVQLITNIDWTFRGGQQTVDGVSVNYSMGTYYGSAYAYKIVSTEIVPQGAMYIVFIPEEKTQMTYNYWAYSFSTELGYRDPNRSMVPSIMLCKRDVMKSFLPAIAAVKIVNNDGNSAYDPFRDFIPTQAVSHDIAGAANELAADHYGASRNTSL